MEVTLGTWRISAERRGPPEAGTTKRQSAGTSSSRFWATRGAYEDLFDCLLIDRALNSLRDGGRVLDCGVDTAAFSLASRLPASDERSSTPWDERCVRRGFQERSELRPCL